MKAVLEQYNDFIHGGDPYIRQFFLLRSIKPMVLLISCYILFVTWLGPALMRNRKPLQLKKVIIVYNFALVLYYIYFLLGGLYFLIMMGPRKMFCDNMLDSRTSSTIALFYLHGYITYAVRYVELIDTVFLVLSKKNRMVTPLHVFHHSIVPIFGWFGFRTEKTAYLGAFLGLNSFIHIIMYSYYAVAALGPKYQKYLWWKKYLTTLQIVQFFLTTIYLATMYTLGCVTSHFVGICSSALMVVFFFWFIDFYRNTFIKRHQKSEMQQQNGSSAQQQNGFTHHDKTK